MTKLIKKGNSINTISGDILDRRAAEKIREIEGDFKKKSPWYVKSFNEFCNATALHGYSYIVRKDTAKWEKY